MVSGTVETESTQTDCPTGEGGTLPEVTQKEPLTNLEYRMSHTVSRDNPKVPEGSQKIIDSIGKTMRFNCFDDIV